MLQNKNLLISALSLIFIVTLSQSAKFRDIGPTSFEDVLCHYFQYDNDERDVLTKITKTFKPSAKSIFFLETSCRGVLNSRQLCCIESASKYHPDGQIYVIFAGPVRRQNFYHSGISILGKFNNVRLRRINIMDFVQDTPLKDMVMKGALVKGRWRVIKTSSILRLLLLYKFSGIYLDTDMLVAKSLWPLGNNWIGRDDDELSTAAMSFSGDKVGRKFVNEVATYMKDQYSDEDELETHYEATAITAVMSKLCTTQDVYDMSADTCQGFEVYAPDYFYSVPREDGDDFFEAGDIVKDAYGFHIWNKVTHRLPVFDDSRFAKLAKQHCPVTYEKYDDKFFLDD